MSLALSQKLQLKVWLKPRESWSWNKGLFAIRYMQAASLRMN